MRLKNLFKKEPILFLVSNDKEAPSDKHKLKLVNLGIFSTEVELVKI